jgi:hypothetical protein
MVRATSAGTSVEHMGAPAASFRQGRRNLTQRRRDAEAQKGKEREAFSLVTASSNPGFPALAMAKDRCKGDDLCYLALGHPLATLFAFLRLCVPASLR